MTKPLRSPALAAFAAATAGRNMTRVASIAVALGIGAMVLSTMDAADEAANRWIVALLWGCLACFVAEWGVRVQRAALKRRTATYLRLRAGACWIPSR